MSLSKKIAEYQRLKLCLCENRHLYARLLGILGLSSSVPSQFTGTQAQRHKGAYPRKQYIHLSPSYSSRNAFDASICVPLGEYCELCIAPSTDCTEEEVERRTLLEALTIFPSVADWKGAFRTFDSDVFVAFVKTLSSLNARASLQLVRQKASGVMQSKRCPRLDTSIDSSYSFSATVLVELAHIDESDTRFVCHRGDDTMRTGLHQECVSLSGRKFDFGVSSKPAASARNAMKEALCSAVKKLDAIAVEELRCLGKESALLLNEMRVGGACTTDMDMRVLDGYLHCYCKTADRSFKEMHCHPQKTTTQEEVLHRYVLRTILPSQKLCKTQRSTRSPTRMSKDQGPSLNMEIFSVTKEEENGEADALLTPLAVYRLPVMDPVEFTVPHWLSNASASRAPYQLKWPVQSLSAALLTTFCNEKMELYRNNSLTDDVLRLSVGLNTFLQRQASETEQSSLPHFLDHFTSDMNSVAGVLFSKYRSSSDAEANSQQNGWYCPDVVVMIAQMRHVLALPSSSFPDIRFEQVARHDPILRVEQLSRGGFGDVDVSTKVTVSWASAKGPIFAVAESSSDAHHLFGTELGREATHPTSSSYGSSTLDVESAGSLQGPLPLLIAAICDLYNKVFQAEVSRHEDLSQRLYPLLLVKDAQTRKGIDFLLYSWFGATPQIRCFDIASSAFVGPDTLARASWSVGNGATRQYVGPFMTRAMLFYDLLGQRILFAETHAVDVKSAVERVSQRAICTNIPRIDSYRATPSPVWWRSFRSIAQHTRWQESREAFLRFLRTSLAASTGNQTSGCAFRFPPSKPSMVTKQGSGETALACEAQRTEARASLKTLVQSCTSELMALLAVLEVLTSSHVTVGAAAEEASQASRQHSFDSQISVAWLVDSALPDSPLETSRPWYKQPYGKEMSSSISGIAELHVHSPYRSCPPIYRRAMRVWGVEEEEVMAVSIGATQRMSSDCTGGWPLTSEPSSPTSGLLPSLTIMCREALNAVYAELSTSLLSIFPPLRVVQRWCKSVGCVVARDGFPDFHAGYYNAPRFLGVALQGICSKYECQYSLVPSPFDTKRQKAAMPATAESATDETTVPKTIFYASAPYSVGAGEDFFDEEKLLHVQRVLTSSSSPLVQCQLMIPMIYLHRNCHSNDANGAADLKAAAVSDGGLVRGFLIGRGLGRSKREAWRSAAWQALRLQFPQLFQQLIALKAVAMLMRDPLRFNQLAVRHDKREYLTAAPTIAMPNITPRVLFDLQWRWRSSTGAKEGGAIEGDAEQLVRCSAEALATDGTVVPVGQLVTGTTATEAFLRAVSSLLSSAARPSGEVVMATTAYAQWWATTNYGKSWWHALMGAMTCRFQKEARVELICQWRSGTRGGHHDEGCASLSSVVVLWREKHQEMIRPASATSPMTRVKSVVAFKQSTSMLKQRSSRDLDDRRLTASLLLLLIYEATAWLEELVEQSALSSGTEVELHGLWCGLRRQIQRLIQCKGLSLLERCTALLEKLVGRRTRARVRPIRGHGGLQWSVALTIWCRADEADEGLDILPTIPLVVASGAHHTSEAAVAELYTAIHQVITAVFERKQRVREAATRQ